MMLRDALAAVLPSRGFRCRDDLASDRPVPVETTAATPESGHFLPASVRPPAHWRPGALVGMAASAGRGAPDRVKARRFHSRTDADVGTIGKSCSGGGRVPTPRSSRPTPTEGTGRK